MYTSTASGVVKQIPQWVVVVQELGIPSLVGVLIGGVIGWISASSLWKRQSIENARQVKIDKSERLVSSIKKFWNMIKDTANDLEKEAKTGLHDLQKSKITDRFRIGKEGFYDSVAFVDLWTTPNLRGQFEKVKKMLNEYLSFRIEEIYNITDENGKKEKRYKDKIDNEIERLVSMLRFWTRK